MKWLEGVHCNIIWFDFPVITMQTTVGKNPTKISSGSEKCNIQIFDTIFSKNRHPKLEGLEIRVE